MKKHLVSLLLTVFALSTTPSSAIQFDPCIQKAADFVSELNMDPDFNVTLIQATSTQTNFIVIYDPLTDSYDAINIANYSPDNESQTAADYYYNNSASFFFDLNVDEEATYSDQTSGLVFAPAPCSLEEFQGVMNSLGGALFAQQFARTSSTLVLNGAHHRTLMDQADDQQGLYTWATGDFARYDDFDANQNSGEVGVSHDFGNADLRAGLALGYSRIDQDLSFSGSNDSEGGYILAELDYRIPNSNLIASALVYYGDWNVDIDRGYPVGGGTDLSSGSTDSDTLAIRLRADLKDCYKLGSAALTPRLSYTYIRTTTDGYSESGGLFPTTFNKQSTTDHEIRLGLDADIELSSRTSLRGIIELVHRINDDSALDGNIAGIGGFNVNVSDDDDTWARLGLEISHKFNDSQTLNLAVFGSNEGADPSISGAISFGVSF